MVIIIALLVIGYALLLWAILYIRTQERKAASWRRMVKALEANGHIPNVERLVAIRDSMRESIR